MDKSCRHLAICLNNLLLSTAFVMVFVDFGESQESAVLRYQKNGEVAGDWLGFSVANSGDVNGDGKNDFIIGAPKADPGGLSAAGSIFVYSGADGALLYRKNGGAAGDYFGYSVAGAGDVNGDGRADIIIGAWGADPNGLRTAGSTYVYSGADGSLLWQLDGSAQNERLGWSVSGAGDVNGDGKADFIVGAPFASPFGIAGAGSAYVYSGVDRALLFQINGADTSGWLGWCVAGAGDVNGDGKADLIISAPNADSGSLTDAGAAYVYSGTNGTLLYGKYGEVTNAGLGWSLAAAGDVNADGRADFVIGAPGASPGGVTDAGSAYVYSGRDGTLLFRKDGNAYMDFLGDAVSGAGDVDGDGRADFIIGADFADPGGLINAGTTYVYSGGDGSLLCQINGDTDVAQLGHSVAGLGDLNGDGRAEFIVGAPFANPNALDSAGSAFVYSFVSTGVTDQETQQFPRSFKLSQNFPNPFNPSTEIQIDLPETKAVRLDIFDILGRKVLTLVNQTLHGGHFRVVWDGKDGQGKSVASGVYFYQLTAGQFQETKRMVVLK